ncbi:hypothetical protein AC578_9006 [Pseudocercospora eumusae]|uniref:Uncharacterized protein n=1 Tax=Pseudocercospora eumusae TaxID=321146 RepID=A0A139HA81_9PEZI|nr:hypothetical protein AC578_9006 [Pseudocercospora eumusae]
MPSTLANPNSTYTNSMSDSWVHDQNDCDQQNGIWNDALTRQHEKPTTNARRLSKAASTSTTGRLVSRFHVREYLERVVLPLKLAWANRRPHPEQGSMAEKRRTRIEGSQHPSLTDPGNVRNSVGPSLDTVYIPDPTLLHDMQLEMDMGRVLPMRNS